MQYRLVLVLLISMVSSQWAQANECSAVFPDGLQNNNSQGFILFGSGSQLINSFDNILASSNAINQPLNAAFTCDTVSCSSSGSIAVNVNYPIPNVTGVDITVASNGTATFAPGNYNNLQLNFQSVLNLSAGDYVFNGNFEAGSASQINIIGSGVVRIFVAGTSQVNFQAEINANGTASNLLLYFSDDTNLGSESEIKAFIYSNANITLNNEAQVTGAISANTVDLGSTSFVQFEATVPEFGDFCQSQQVNPILEYRFDECSYTGDPGDVIDNIGSFNGTSTDILIPNSTGVVNTAIDMASVNPDPYKFITVPKEAINGLNDFTIATWVKIPNQNGQRNQIISALGNNTNDDQLEFVVNNNGNTVYVKLLDDDELFAAGQDLTDDSWHHVSITRKDSNICLYVDGQQQECKNTSPVGSLSVSNNNAVVIGQEQDSFGGSFQRDQSFLGQLDEFKIYDSELSSADINLIYSNELAANNYDGSARAVVDCAPRFEAGRITLEDTEGIDSTGFDSNSSDLPAGFSQVCFDTPFSEPPAVFTMPTRQTNELTNRLTLRIRNVTETGFQVTQVRSQGANDPNGYDPQTVDFIAVKKGNYLLAGNQAVTIGAENVTQYQARNRGGASWRNVTLDLPNVPAVLATMQTMNNEFADGPFPFSQPFMAATVRNVQANNFQLAIEQGETNTSFSQAENIAYLAITPGTGVLIPASGGDPGVTYEAIRTPQNIRGLAINDCRVSNFTSNFANTPLVIASQNTRNGSDGGWLERCSISANSVGFNITEDGRDNDLNHINERAGVLALGGNFADYTNSCGPSIDHFEIDTLNAEGLTCEEDTITLKACANADCSALSTDAVDVNFTVLGVDGFTKTVTIIGGQVDVNYRYTEIGNASLTLTPVDPQITNDVECADNASLSTCDVDFKETGFRFVNGTVNGIVNQNLPVQLSGKPSNVGFNATTTLAIEAVTTDGNATPSCEALLVTTGQSIEMGAKYQSPLDAPSSGPETVNILETAGTTGTDVTLVNNASGYIYTQVPLDFGADSQNFANYVFTYNNAGSILLNARYQLPDEDGNPSGDYITGTSNPIIVRPFAFDIQVVANPGINNPAAQSASGAVFMAAGDPMTITSRAVAWQSGNDSNGNGLADQGEDISGNPTTTNFTYDFTASNASLVHSLIAPSGGQQGSLSGTFSGNFTAGENSFVTSFSEVGIIDLAVNASNYLAAGVNIAGKTPFVGRFTPAYFEQTINSQGILKGEHFNGVCEDENWVYTGQKTVENANGVYQSNDTKGAIRYLIPPVIDITAYNRSGSITQNYTSAGFIKFSNLQQTSSSNPHIIITAPTTDDTAPQSLTASMSLGADPVEKNNSAQTMPIKGVVSYTFNNADNYFYDHISSAEVAEFFAKIPFVIASITDSDGVMLNTATGATPTVKVVTQGASPGLGVRFGRWTIENGYGPETSDLTVAMPIQYFNGSYYVTNDLENCTVPAQGTRDNANINSGNMAATYNYRLADNDLSDTLTPADTTQTLLPLNSGANPSRFYQGLYRFLSFSAVGNGAAGNNKKGRLDFEYQVPPWLQYDWNGNSDNDDAYDQNPTAILTFGLYRGNDRIIYQRERFN